MSVRLQNGHCERTYGSIPNMAPRLKAYEGRVYFLWWRLAYEPVLTFNMDYCQVWNRLLLGKPDWWLRPFCHVRWTPVKLFKGDDDG